MSNETVTSARVARSMLAVLAAAVITIASGVSAAAESPDELPQKIVSYKDLDLSNSKDIAVLYRRIQRGAAAVCGDYDALEQMHRPAVRACIKSATSEAVAAVNSPLLTRFHNSNTGNTEKVASLAR
jgi:UrcA family protein